MSKSINDLKKLLEKDPRAKFDGPYHSKVSKLTYYEDYYVAGGSILSYYNEGSWRTAYLKENPWGIQT